MRERYTGTGESRTDITRRPDLSLAKTKRNGPAQIRTATS
jgi:hypothetical protein